MNREEEDFEKAAEKLEPKNYVEHAALVALAKVKLCEQRIASLHFAVGGRRSHSSDGAGIDGQYSKIHASLYLELNQAYSHLFMFALVSNNKDLEKKAAKMANERFLRENNGIMGYLNLEGDFSRSYSSVVESEFRSDITEQLIAKGLDPVALVTDCPKCHAYRGQSCRGKAFKKVKSHKPRQLKALKIAVNPDKDA